VVDLELLTFKLETMINKSTDLKTTTEPAITYSECYNQPFLNVLSLGAGKQSSYMLLTALEGAYNSKPNFAIFSDTGCEPEFTYQFLYWLKDHVKSKYDFDIVIVSKGNIMTDTIDYIEGKKARNPQIPLRLGDGGGILNRHCTSDYKIAPIRKHLQSVRNGAKIRLWIGISLDEIERQKTSDVQYIEHYYPLIEKRIKIDQIREWFRLNDVPEPMKSSCLICPFHSQQYWQIFKKNFPNEFEKACQFDEKIRNYPKLKSKAYLYKDLKPLRDIDFSQQPSLFPELIEECYGLCGL